MKKLVLSLLALMMMTASQAQPAKCLSDRDAKPVKMDRVLAPDFTITDTDGNSLNLYNTLNEGKTVFLDFFYTTCGYCIQYSPIIEQVYQNHGAGQGDIVFWGLSDRDNNASVNAYKAAHNVSNPCAGSEGGGNTATSLYTSNFNFTGWPTYTIICPDKTVKWDVNYPPTVTGFNTYFSQCGATGIPEKAGVLKTKIQKMFPVPANNNLNLEINVGKPGELRVEIFNLLGVKVMNKSFSFEESGAYQITLNTSGLNNGNYFLKLIEGNYVTEVQKFTKF